jgi:hypothetical protein
MVKIKGPILPPGTSSSVGPGKQAGDVKTKSGKVANALASLVGGQEEAKKKERKKALEHLTEAEKRKRLKSLGSKCGVSANDSPEEATKKIVKGVLDEEYDREKGFDTMVDTVASFIRNDEKLVAFFDESIKVMQSEEG